MSGIKTLPVSEEAHERMKKVYQTLNDGKSLIRTSPGNLLLPSGYEKYKEQIYNLALRPDDIYVLTFAKNGTTWTQQMVWSIINAISSTEKVTDLVKVPFLEFGLMTDFAMQKIPGGAMEEVFATIEAMPSSSPRIIRSHLPYFALPPNILDQCKVVTCLRNPKDSLVSGFHHHKLMGLSSSCSDFDVFFDLFMRDEMLCCPYWDYTVEAWKRRDHPNLCLLFFEDMKLDLESNVRKVAKFLEKELSDDQVKILVENLTFKNMKKSGAAFDKMIQKMSRTEGNKGSFFRKGDVGDWKNYFTEEMNKRMDEAIEKHFKGTGPEFRYE